MQTMLYKHMFFLTAVIFILYPTQGVAIDLADNTQVTAPIHQPQATSETVDNSNINATTTHDSQLQQSSTTAAAVDNTTTNTSSQPLIPSDQSGQPIEMQQPPTQSEDEIVKNSEQLLKRFKSIAPNLEDSLTMAELLLALDKIKEDTDRCNDDEMLIIIKQKERKIRERLEAISPENLQYLALMQRSQKDPLDAVLYTTVSISAIMLLSLLALSTYDNSTDTAPWFDIPSEERISQNIDRVKQLFT